MEQKRAEKIIDYVSSMTDYYDVNPQRIISDLKEPETEKEEAIRKVYSSIEGKAFCDSCNNMKLRDEQNDEYYCPKCC